MRTVTVQIRPDGESYRADVKEDDTVRWSGIVVTKSTDWRKVILEMLQTSWQRPGGDKQ